MMSDYTPSDDDLVRHFRLTDAEKTAMFGGEDYGLITREAFDRWLAAHDAKVWDNGHGAGDSNYTEGWAGRKITNPYRPAPTEQEK
jgi:hypothetical protein